MSYIDIAILIPLFYAAYKGFKKGLIIEVATLVALIAGIFGAIHFSFYIEDMLGDKTDISDKYIPLAAVAITFIGIVVGIHFLARFIEKMIKLAALGLVNRIFGLVFSVTKMALIVSFIIVFLNSLNDKYSLFSKQQQEASYLLQPFSVLGPTLMPIVTESAWYAETNLKKELEEVVNSVDLEE